MEKFAKPFVVVLLFMAAVTGLVLSLDKKPHPKVVLTGNVEKKPIEIFPHAYLCSMCKMEIDKKRFSAQVVNDEGKTRFFDDIGCMALWLDGQPFKDGAAIWVYALDTGRWIDGRKAHYSTDEATPMHYGFGAYEKRRAGTVNFETVVDRMRKGMHMANPEYRKVHGERE